MKTISSIHFLIIQIVDNVDWKSCKMGAIIQNQKFNSLTLIQVGSPVVFSKVFKNGLEFRFTSFQLYLTLNIWAHQEILSRSQ